MSTMILNALRRQCLSQFRVRLFQQPYFTSREFHRSQAVFAKKVNRKDELFHLEAVHSPDQFGTLSPQVDEPETPDEGDLKEEDFLQNLPTQGQKLSVRQYADMIKDHLKNNRIREALDVVEVRMKQDRVKPVNYHFNLLISGCARVGYSKKAFQLYNKMKQHGLKVTGGTYTSLFNGCAISPFLGDGLKRANHLREVMLEKGYEPNEMNYNAMIKAYGRCGDLKTAFQLADEMVARRLNVATETFNFLLQACISDREYGFRHALLVWHKMHRMRISPDRFSFNLLLRCVRDCQLGELETMEQVIEQILSQSIGHPPQQLGTVEAKQASKSTLVINDASADESTPSLQITNLDSELTDRLNHEGVPDLLSPKPHLGSLVKLGEVRKAEDRLLLLGGSTNVFAEMKRCNVEPDIRTLTELLDVIPPTYAAEKQLLTTIKQLKLRCDIDFFNILIKKRSMRFDYEGAREVLYMIEAANLEPDIITYGVLALGCQTQEEARSLLKMMEQADVRMNIQILGAMLRQGCARNNFRYITEVLNIVRRERLKPNEPFLRHFLLCFFDCEFLYYGYIKHRPLEFKGTGKFSTRLTEQDLAYMAKQAKDHFDRIMETLKSMPRNLILVIRNLNTIRSIARDHGDPIDRPRILARCALAALCPSRRNVRNFLWVTFRKLRFEFLLWRQSFHYWIVSYYLRLLTRVGRSPDTSHLMNINIEV